MADLRPFQTIDLAKTGDSEKCMVLREYTLEVRNDNGIGVDNSTVSAAKSCSAPWSMTRRVRKSCRRAPFPTTRS